MQTHGARRFDKLGRPAIANIVRRAEGLDQDSDETFFPIAKTPPPADGLRGTGGPQRPSWRSEGPYASPLRREYSQSLTSHDPRGLSDR